MRSFVIWQVCTDLYMHRYFHLINGKSTQLITGHDPINGKSTQLITGHDPINGKSTQLVTGHDPINGNTGLSFVKSAVALLSSNVSRQPTINS
jgi:hypothetical protein